MRAVESYGEALREAALAELPVLFYENESGYSLHDALAELGGLRSGGPDASGGRPMAAPTVSLMTGAEGGFSGEEIEKARAAGMKICTLGPRILRCETAPLAGLTAVMFALGEI